MNPTQGKFHHLAIQSRNLEESLHFYIDVLGMKKVGEITLSTKKGVFIDMGNGSLIELFSPPFEGDADLPDYENSKLVLYHFAIAIEDVAGSIDHCRQAGYLIIKEATHLKLEDGFEATIGFVEGPNGERVEFINQYSAW